MSISVPGKHTVHIKFLSINCIFLIAPYMLCLTTDYVAFGRKIQGTAETKSPEPRPAVAKWHQHLQLHCLPRQRWGCQPVGNGLDALGHDSTWSMKTSLK